MADSTVKHVTSVFPIDAEAVKPDPKSPRRRSIIRDFSLNTSTHGIPGIARSKSIHNRIFWTISLLAFTGIMIYFITQSIQAYFNYPTQTSVSFVVERSQTFPAVSICNYEPIRLDTFIQPFREYLKSRNLLISNDTKTIDEPEANYIRDFLQNALAKNQSIDKYFFPLNAIVISCIYNGKSCHSTDFIQFLSATHGACYTFNAKRKSNPSGVRKTTQYGGNGKLELQLYAHSHQYMPYVSEDVSAGMMAMVHDNTELPLIEAAGIQLSPGFRHKLSYKKRTYNLLPSPYSTCTKQIPLVMQAMFDRYGDADYAYSPVLCNILCVQRYLYQECGCIDPYQWTARSVVVPGTSRIFEALLCNITDACSNNATDRIQNSDELWNEFCSDCAESCSTTDFTVTPSAVSAPSRWKLSDIELAVQESGIPTPDDWNTTWQTYIKDNFIGLDVTCESTRVEIYDEDASISGVDVLSNVGGHTGLWIGISFLSLMEIVEMLYRLIRYHIHRLGRNKFTNKQTSTDIHEQL